MNAIFLDKDGTLIDDVPNNVDPKRITLSGGAGAGLRIFARLGFHLFVVSNQAGVAMGEFAEADLAAVRHRLAELFEGQHVRLDGFYYCPHHPEGSVPQYALACNCRKPNPGMLLHAAAEHDIDLHASWMIGDILDDIEAGNLAGCRTILIDNGHETQWLRSVPRTPDFVAWNLHAAALLVARETMAARHLSRRADSR